jgi:uncharacterized protein
MAASPILIAAFSGRAAAAAARRAGFAPLVADLFADDDTREAAENVRRVEGDLSTGLEEGALLDALSELGNTASEPPIGILYGAGFEDRPALLGRIAQRWPLIGNALDTVAAVKDPGRLAQTLGSLGIPHPEIARLPARSGWLIKRRGGAGGDHVSTKTTAQEGLYAQRRVQGRSISALFVSTGGGAEIIGFSEQWTAPSATQPFRFGGGAAPADISAGIAERLAEAVRRVSQAFNLKGLNSIDFIVGPKGWWLIEINPRLGATLDLFDTADGALLRSHIAAVRGSPTAPHPRLAGGRALEVLYAPRAIRSIPRLTWPDWVADRPAPSQQIAAEGPLCTILASAMTACDARRLCRARADQLFEILGLSQWTTSQASA